MKRLRRQQLADHAGGQCWAPGILTPGLLPQEEMGVGRVPPGPAGLVRGGPGFASSLEGLCVPAGSAPASPHTPCLWAARHHPELNGTALLGSPGAAARCAPAPLLQRQWLRWARAVIPGSSSRWRQHLRLGRASGLRAPGGGLGGAGSGRRRCSEGYCAGPAAAAGGSGAGAVGHAPPPALEIGRASCRERV